MPISKAQQKATVKYSKANYDDVRFRVPKGEKQMIADHAQSCGESVNAFLHRAVQETIERDKQK